MMASTHVYDLSAVKEKPRGSGTEQGRVELILDPSELDLVDNEGTLAARYEQQLKEQQSHLQKEDLSDMVAEHAAKQKVVLFLLVSNATTLRLKYDLFFFQFHRVNANARCSSRT